jgi:2-oxo-4-hydroxy-4-carboxy-5-ureidoimidazoline decarboxylase
MTLEELNALASIEAEGMFLRCCGSRHWAEQMAWARPFAARDALHQTADRIWWSLDPPDWREAFAAHPRIGERSRTRWSLQEQSGAHSAGEATRAELAAVNAAYEARFGYIFIVCASGKSGDDMVAIARERLHNDAETELRVAATEQAAITRLRLDKLLDA